MLVITGGKLGCFNKYVGQSAVFKLMTKILVITAGKLGCLNEKHVGQSKAFKLWTKNVSNNS
jgi:hypothetical protein